MCIIVTDTVHPLLTSSPAKLFCPYEFYRCNPKFNFPTQRKIIEYLRYFLLEKNFWKITYPGGWTTHACLCLWHKFVSVCRFSSCILLLFFISQSSSFLCIRFDLNKWHCFCDLYPHPYIFTHMWKEPLIAKMPPRNSCSYAVFLKQKIAVWQGNSLVWIGLRSWEGESAEKTGRPLHVYFFISSPLPRILER